MEKLLTTAQANAIYRAMTEANNVGARLHARIEIESGHNEGWTLHISEFETGYIQVSIANAIGSLIRAGQSESYRGQAHFAQAYGIE